MELVEEVGGRAQAVVLRRGHTEIAHTAHHLHCLHSEGGDDAGLGAD